ncbi:cytosolic sulfotransferase 8-like [Daucus carota subsp. sativus]|uniref:cytosolic sulfotransferase 8-like n=1 Tax=Daucus carota subsp. sativus TaxID=79200 RepID=UPI0007EF0843|nr:PREDICTED: cytosolic sulfotransferase 8-like [Daucus carota subsp. sativus]
MEAKTTESPQHDQTLVCSQEWLSSLPKAKGVTEDYTYQYQGFWFGCLPKSITEEDGSANIKIVYFCRDIKDTSTSLFHFANNIGLRSSPVSLEEAFHFFCQGTNVAGPIWDQILEYWKESLERPNKVLFMRYEELKSEPHAQLRRLAQFLGRPFSPEEENMEMVDQITSLCSFGSMSKLQVNSTGNLLPGVSNSSFFRNGQVGEGNKCLFAHKYKYSLCN